MNHIAAVENIIVYFDNSLTTNIEELVYMITHISYHFNFNNQYDSIKFKSQNIENLKDALECVKTYFNGNLNNSYKKILNNIKEKQKSNQNIRKNFGGTKMTHILKKQYIKNISNNSMKNTINYLKKKIKRMRQR